jgi:hypothetical protein
MYFKYKHVFTQVNGTMLIGNYYINVIVHFPEAKFTTRWTLYEFGQTTQTSVIFAERWNNLSIILMVEQQFYINGSLVSLHIFYSCPLRIQICKGYWTEWLGTSIGHLRTLMLLYTSVQFFSLSLLYWQSDCTIYKSMSW